MQESICLIFGATDTGKTALSVARARRAASSGPVGFIDVNIGQSHIGTPATVGWALVDNPRIDFSELAADGIDFVGDITPVSHPLQLHGHLASPVTGSQTHLRLLYGMKSKRPPMKSSKSNTKILVATNFLTHPLHDILANVR